MFNVCPFVNFLFVGLTDLYPWTDSKLHEEIEPSLFCLIAASPAFSSVWWLNLSLVNIIEGLGALYSRKEKELPGEITWAG